MKILFVDDDADMRDLVELALQFEGINAQVTDAVAAAKQALAADAFDAVVCDYHLGAAGCGAELLAHVRAHHPALPFLLTTGDPAAAAALDLPPNDVLHKPVEIEALAVRLKTMVAG